jgi:hypothetical protein
MKSIILILIFTSFSICQVSKKTVLEQSKILAEAFTNQDFNTIVTYTYPRIIKMMGGKEKMISILKSGKLNMENEGVFFESVSVKKPSEIYQSGNELYCLIPQTIIMKIPKGKLETNGYLLAVSEDNGEKWFFIDTAQLDDNKLAYLFPNMNKKLKIPKKTRPTFYAD